MPARPCAWWLDVAADSQMERGHGPSGPKAPRGAHVKTQTPAPPQQRAGRQPQLHRALTVLQDRAAKTACNHESQDESAHPHKCCNLSSAPTACRGRWLKQDLHEEVGISKGERGQRPALHTAHPASVKCSRLVCYLLSTLTKV